jgi:hypothetical protein
MINLGPKICKGGNIEGAITVSQEKGAGVRRFDPAVYQTAEPAEPIYRINDIHRNYPWNRPGTTGTGNFPVYISVSLVP